MKKKVNHSTAPEVIRQLKQLGTTATITGMARYGIPSDHALGVTVGKLKQLSKELGKDHELAIELWKSGIYEARMLAAFVDEPEKVTAKQMDSWVRDFDNWAICDHCCFHLFDQTKPAWKKLPTYARSKSEFTKRCAFALLWSLSLHDKQAPDANFLECFPLIEAAATDERHLVKKSVDMALCALGRRNRNLNKAAIALTLSLSKSDDKTAAWIGKKSLRELQSPKIQDRLKS